MLCNIIGIDCATDPRKTGLARGHVGDGTVVVRSARHGDRDIVETIADWLAADSPCLLALDAPLGWPVALADSLANHIAGDPLPHTADALFRRTTDDRVRKLVGKRPLEVGANFIARTAHTALRLLAQLRDRLRIEIPLSWDPTRISEVEAIEVYPAATLAARDIDSTGYKPKTAIAPRRRIIERLRSEIDLNLDVSVLEHSADALDAVICVLAGADYLRGVCVAPENTVTARREGWIWVRKPVTDK